MDTLPRRDGDGAYRTKAGLRLLAIHDVFDPLSAQVETVFQELEPIPVREVVQGPGGVPARLTPKPWRCGSMRPPAGWPWDDANSEQALSWKGPINASPVDYATCQFVGFIGNEAAHPDVQPLIDFHDESTRAMTDLPFGLETLTQILCENYS